MALRFGSKEWFAFAIAKLILWEVKKPSRYPTMRMIMMVCGVEMMAY